MSTERVSGSLLIGSCRRSSPRSGCPSYIRAYIPGMLLEARSRREMTIQEEAGGWGAVRRIRLRARPHSKSSNAEKRTAFGGWFTNWNQVNRRKLAETAMDSLARITRAASRQSTKRDGQLWMSGCVCLWSEFAPPAPFLNASAVDNLSVGRLREPGAEILYSHLVLVGILSCPSAPTKLPLERLRKADSYKSSREKRREGVG
jgi:hypothetical protein